MPGLVVLLVFAVAVVADEAPLLQLPQGSLRGFYGLTASGRAFASFKGIPYAQPPLGDLRFQQSLPALGWTGVYDATKTPNDCMQYSHTHYKVEGSEDCLYANVYVPEVPKRKTPLEVIIYIHGGAFMFLSSAVYQPHYLLDKDVILVTFNYRLGALGFLSTEDYAIPGNNGLKDQLLLLKWVNQNIEYFGGNPKKITIAGMSAGGASVHYHLLSPLSRGLFSNAISMSGTALCNWAQAENMREKAFQIGDAVGCHMKNSNTLAKCLRTKPAEEIVGSVKMFQPWLYHPFSPLGPVIEPSGPNAFITRAPIDSEFQGNSTDVPWLVSITRDEGLYPGAEIITDDQHMATLSKRWNELAPFLLDFNYTASPQQKADISKTIWKHYFGTGGLTQRALIKLLSERLFDVAVEETAKIHAMVYKSPVYAYLFSYRGEHSLSDIFGKRKLGWGVSHADDTGYILASYYMNHTSQADLKMKDLMTEMWASFAKTGVPSFQSYAGEWKPIKKVKEEKEEEEKKDKKDKKEKKRKELPEFTYLDILSPESAELKSPKLFSTCFWDSLKLQENIPSPGVPVPMPKEEL